MEVEIHDRSRQRIGTATVNPQQRPSLVRVQVVDGKEQEVYLDWEGALDDAGRLRSCVVCRCPQLYRRRTLPRFAPFALVLAAAGVVAGFLGYSSNPVVLVALVALVGLDVMVLFLARTELVCYRCNSVYRQIPVARYHRAWDVRIATDERGNLLREDPATNPGNEEPPLPSNR